MRFYLTNVGQALLYKAQGGQQLKFTRFVLGDGELNGQAIQTLTNLISEKLSADIRKLEIKSNKVVLGMSFTNAELVEGFYFRELGIYAEDPDTSEEVLYMYANAGETADYIDSNTGRVIEEYLDVEIQVSDVESISAVIDESLVYLTQKGDVSETTAIFEEVETRENINSSESIKTIFGKIKKFFTDLKAVAFSGSYNDLIDVPTSFKPTNHTHTGYVNKTGDIMTGALTTTAITIGSRASGSAVGANSYAQGGAYYGSDSNPIASGQNSFSQGSSTTASGAMSHASGWGTTASGAASHAENYESTASGDYSHAEGCGTTASGMYSHASGWGTTASGDYSYAGGCYTTANKANFSIGHHNKAPAEGGQSGTAGDAFIIGNGKSSSKSNAFRVSYAGAAYGSSSFNSSGADYAEITEWADGNSNNEDRVGRFVCMEGEKMRFANSKDVRSRIGVVSADPAVVGDNYSEDWCGKYKTDIFGRKLTQVVHHEAEYDENGKLLTKACDSVEWILADDYDDTKEYVRREERQEYDYFGLLGKLIVIDDGTCEAGGYCYPNDEAVATKELDENKGFYVMSRIDETHIKILLR